MIVSNARSARLKEILAAVRVLAVEYYELTGKPLGVTGEVAECVAAEALGLELAPPRTPGYDAIRYTSEQPCRIQIKGRAYSTSSKRNQRLGRIKQGAPCDAVLLVLLDSRSLEPFEMWEASYSDVEERIKVPGSKSRNRGSLSVKEFKKVARRVWSQHVD